MLIELFVCSGVICPDRLNTDVSVATIDRMVVVHKFKLLVRLKNAVTYLPTLTDLPFKEINNRSLAAVNWFGLMYVAYK